MGFGQGVFLRMSAAKVSRKAKQNGGEEKVVAVEQDKQSQKSNQKPASQKGSAKGSNKRDDVSETPVLQSQEAEMEEVYYYQAGDIVLATYLGLDWPGKILRPLKQYSLYRIQLFQLGKTVQYPIDVIKDYNQSNKEISTKRFQNAENRHADLAIDKFRKAIEEADLAKKKLDEKESKNQYFRKAKKHKEIEKVIFDQILKQEKEKQPFDTNHEEEHKMQKEPKKGNKKASNQKKLYEKKIQERARQMANKLSENVETEKEAVVQQSLSYSIVVIGPEKPQEQKPEDKGNENASKSVENTVELKKQDSKAEKGSVSQQQQSLKDQSVRSSQERGGHTDSQSNGPLSEKQISSHIAQSLNHDDDEDYFKGNEPSKTEKEANEFITHYEDQYQKLQKKLASLPNLPNETRVQICENVLDLIMTEFSKSHRSDHYLPLLKTVLTKGVISLTGFVNSCILIKSAIFIKSYEQQRKNDAYELQYRFLRQFRESIVSQPAAKDGATRALQQRAINGFKPLCDD